MKEALIFGFDIESYCFYKRNYPEIDIVGWFGQSEIEPKDDGVITFEDRDLYSATQHTDKPQAIVFYRNIRPDMIPDTMPIPIMNSFYQGVFYTELEPIIHRVYVLEAMFDGTAVRGVNVLAEPGVLVGAHATLSHGVELKSFVRVRENCSIGSLTSIGARSYIEPGCIIGSNVKIGEDVFVCAGTVIPSGTEIQSGSRVTRNDY